MRRRPSTLLAGLAHSGGQLLGVVLAILVSHLIARRLGASPEADAFFLGRRVATSLSEALSQALAVLYIPLVAAHAVRHGAGARRETLRQVAYAALVGVALAAGIALSAGAIVDGLAPEFPEEIAKLARLTLATFGAALPATMACIVFAAAMNVGGRFGAPSTIRQLPRAAIALSLAFAGGNIVLVGAGAYSAAWYLVVVLMLAMYLRSTAPSASGAASSPGEARPSTRAAVGGIAAMVLVIGALSTTLLETAFAAGIGPGGVTELELSQRLGTLLANTLGAALSLVVFAAWSRRSAEGGSGPTTDQFWRAAAIGLMALVPAQCYFALNSDALVDVLLAHGEFTAEDAAAVARSLRWMTLAPLSAFVLRILLVRVLVDPEAPTLRLICIGVVMDIVAKFALFSLLTPSLGIVGIAIAEAIAPVISILLLLALGRRWSPSIGAPQVGGGSRLLAAALAGIAGMLLGARLGQAAGGSIAILPGHAESLAALAGSGLLGGALFLVSIRMLRIPLSVE